MIRLKSLVPLVAFCISAGSVFGFVQKTTDSGVALKRLVLPIQYGINEKGTPDVPGIAERAAVDAAFATWGAISNSNLAFNGGTTSAGFDPMDGMSTILWMDDASDNTLVVGRPDLLALTDVRFNVMSGAIVSADIAMNGVSFSWSVSGNDNFSSLKGPADIQAVVTHEIGHFIGLDHVTNSMSVMFPTMYVGDTSPRSLSQDELSAAVFVYPSAGAPAESSISGQVTRAGVGVARAYVAAFQGGRAIVGAMADAAGNYRIRRLPPGLYQVRAQPYSNSDAVTQTLFYQVSSNVDVNFLSILYMNTASESSATSVTVNAGADTPNINLSVSASGNVNDPFEDDDTGSTAKPIALDGSAQIHHSWDSAPLVGDEDWVTYNAVAGRLYVIETRNLGLEPTDSGAAAAHSATQLELYDSSATSPPYPAPLASNAFRNSFEGDNGSRIVTFEAANAVRKVRARQRQPDTKGAGAYFDLSIRELVGPFASPTVTSVVQGQGTEDGGIVVSVNGTNFIPGAGVTFGGVAGSQIDVQSCQTPTDCRVIKVLVPAHAPGMVTVQVTNLGGGNGSLANGFEYLPRRVGTFLDNTLNAFGDFIGEGAGICWGDYDNDGDQDVFRPTSGVTTYRLLRNNGGGVFQDVTATAGLDTTGLNQRSCAWGDYDNDGYIDLYIVYTSALNALYRNNGPSGTFTNIAAAAGVGGATGSPNDSDAAWADFDLDGDLDLMLLYESSGASLRSHQLFRNNGNSTFTDVAASAGVGFQKYGEHCKWADYDNDGYPDLYLVNLQGLSDQLLHNNRNGTFTDVTSLAGIVEDFHCWNALWADVNDDGFQDLFCSSVTGAPGQNFRLWINAGSGAFVDASASSGVQDTTCSGFGGAITAFDKDNDGDIDLYVGCDNDDRLLENNAADPPFFTNVAIASGVNEAGFPRSAYGVGAADIDNDFDQDVLVTGIEVDADFLWQNRSNTNQGLTVRLIGTVQNKLGIGTRVSVIPNLGANPNEASCLSADGSGNARHLQVIGGSRDQNSIELEFGLASQPIEAREVDCVNVFWPRSGLKRGFVRVAANQLLSITESSPDLLVTKVTPGSGSTAGGTSVTVFGFNFSNAVSSYPKVYFGGVAATGVIFQSANTIQCTTPAHSGGAVDVRVENSLTSANTLPGGYTYIGPGQEVNISVTRSGADVVLNWSDVEQRQYYRVKRALGPMPSNFNPAQVCAIQAGTTYTDVGAASNATNYFYIVDTTLSCP